MSASTSQDLRGRGDLEGLSLRTGAKRSLLLGALIVVAAVFLALNVRVGHAETPRAAPRTTGYEISWSTIDGGEAMNLTGGSYALSGTIGQPDAGNLNGGTYALGGGFWGGAGDLLRLFLPLILR